MDTLRAAVMGRIVLALLLLTSIAIIAVDAQGINGGVVTHVSWGSRSRKKSSRSRSSSSSSSDDDDDDSSSSWSSSTKSSKSKSKSGKSSKSSKGGKNRCITKDRKACVKDRDCEWKGDYCINSDLDSVCLGLDEDDCDDEDDCLWNGKRCKRERDDDDLDDDEFCEDLSKKECEKEKKCDWDNKDDECNARKKKKKNNNKKKKMAMSVTCVRFDLRDCKRNAYCTWEGDVCSQSTHVNTLNERVDENGFIMTQANEPTSGSLATKVSAFFGCAVISTLYQLY
mmetsp:Transcript_19412/g.33310  ORF Transcript_19412/g.33310 Transcript_19412/m.33310 type:complete len:283 (+) Transcript_19412:238-1086(+)